MSENREDVRTLSDLDYWKAAGTAGTSVAAPVYIPAGGRADLFCVTSSTLAATTRSGATLTSETYSAGQPISLDGRVFASFLAAASDWIYAIVPRDALPTFPSIAPGGGGSGGGLNVNGALTVQAGLSAAPNVNTNVLNIGNAAGIIYIDTSGNVVIRSGPDWTSGYVELAASILTGGIFHSYNSVYTAGLGVAPIYAVTTTPVALQTTSTTINNSFTPGATGLFRVTVCVVPLNAFSKTGTVTVSYTDAKTTGTATQSQTIASTSSEVPQSFVFLCNATTAAVITVAGTISTNNDAYATCTIEQLA
jgi:hypothetical protein